MIEKIQGISIPLSQNLPTRIQSDFVQDEGGMEDHSVSGFSAMLQDMASGVVDNIKQAESFSLAALNGKATMREVVDSALQAERSLQASMSIRDKIISAYLEISKMQI
ncbi:flagellar hook-basal body complex protein FliE [Candidatus Liberibacter sp.]|uniref:flagellar hook-basal body complex protein FliE n=1 Tax=Candidatus Liberibacter sp. TaxID=34022 RepID=UPI0015F71609|nr:flagellar hook-basal body complex protein FliE [Candidatus Liberibacter sp.]MBA5723623.1 flagellar hook-basal body complex protein FliE [Candidatus Liberibacter sp.]